MHVSIGSGNGYIYIYEDEISVSRRRSKHDGINSNFNRSVDRSMELRQAGPN